MQLIEFKDKGLYCAPGDFWIDPWKPVKNALITHGHGDHARYGSQNYLAHNDSIPILKCRLGISNKYEGIAYNEPRKINDVTVSFHPAGHIIGSAQIRVEYKGEVWVVSGDYKTEFDGISPAFEPVKCHTFITESTFGLPIYNWQPQQSIFSDINIWWKKNREKGVTSVITAYSLGKAQRILFNIDQSIGEVFLHGAIYNMNHAIIEAGFPIPNAPRVDLNNRKKDIYKGALIIAPPSAAGSAWLRRFTPFSLGVASGWMALRGAKRRQAADKGFVLSDHADWRGLNEAIEATGAERVFVTHGYTATFAAWLRTKGLDSKPVETAYEGELADISNTENPDVALAEEEQCLDNSSEENIDAKMEGEEQE